MSDRGFPSAYDLDRQPHSQRDVDLLYRIYAAKRIQAQTDFYTSRIQENSYNSDFTFSLSTAIMTLSSLFATISASGGIRWMALVAAVLPAFAALLAAFRQLYGWDRQISIYRDTLLGLERIKLMVPDEERIVTSELAGLYPKLVASSESVFTGEVSQWGQFVLDKDKAGEEENAPDSFSRLVSTLNLNSDQIASIQAIMAAGRTPAITIGPVTSGGDLQMGTPLLPHTGESTAEETSDTAVATIPPAGDISSWPQPSAPAEEAAPPVETVDNMTFSEARVPTAPASPGTPAAPGVPATPGPAPAVPRPPVTPGTPPPAGETAGTDDSGAVG